MAPVLVREAALSFGDEESRAYHLGTVSHVVEEQRCACYTAEYVYQVRKGTDVSFVEFVESDVLPTFHLCSAFHKSFTSL